MTKDIAPGIQIDKDVKFGLLTLRILSELAHFGKMRINDLQDLFSGKGDDVCPGYSVSKTHIFERISKLSEWRHNGKELIVGQKLKSPEVERAGYYYSLTPAGRKFALEALDAVSEELDLITSRLSETRKGSK